MATAVHLMIRILDETRSVELYSTAFGLKVADGLDRDALTLVYTCDDESEFEVELTTNKGRQEPYCSAMAMAILRSP